MITLSINLKKVDKNRFKTVKLKNGEEALYLELVMHETPTSQFGDYIVKQQVTKEERKAKLEMAILGNGKNWDKKQSAPRAAREAAPEQPSNQDSTCPF